MPIPLTALPPLTPLTVQDCFGLIWPHWFTHTHTYRHVHTHRLAQEKPPPLSLTPSTHKHKPQAPEQFTFIYLWNAYNVHEPAALLFQGALSGSFINFLCCLHMAICTAVCGHVVRAALCAALTVTWDAERWADEHRWAFRIYSFSCLWSRSACLSMATLSPPSWTQNAHLHGNR